MDFKYFSEPVPHIVIDGFYTPEELKDIWLELDFLTHPRKMLTPELSGSSASFDNEGKLVFKKKNLALFLDGLYANRNISNILHHSRKLYTKEFTDKCAEQHFVFKYFTTCNMDTTLVSYYEEGDHYKAHNDTGSLTILTWLFKEPKAFTGGELSFSDFDHTIELKNNRTLIFPACINHSVSTIKMNEGVELMKGFGRYVITNWASFKS